MDERGLCVELKIDNCISHSSVKGECDVCDSNYYLNESKACPQCDASCLTCEGTGGYCLTCALNYYLTTNVCDKCSASCDNTGCAPETGICKACADNHHRQEDGTCAPN